MSTLSGISVKGEKGKQKYQSLDINSWYIKSSGESLETHQQKSTLPRRHGMQSLGKVPNARRAPANLPSLKSEHSGNDPAVSLVPSGGTGWGSKPGETNPPSTQSTTSTTPTTQTAPVLSVSTTTATVITTTTTTTSSPVAPVAAPVVTSTVTHTPLIPPTSIPAPTPHIDKSWSAIMSNTTEPTPNFLAHQSPFFQQEFPSLSGADSAATTGPTTKTDSTQYGPGPSLRPQTEGSWMQGGSRPQGQMGVGAGSPQGTAPVQGPLPLPHLPPGIDVGGVRSNLAQSGVAVAQGGPVPQPPSAHMQHPPHLRGVMPPFMYRGNFPGNFPPNFQNTLHGPPRPPRFPYLPDSRFMQSSRPLPSTSTPPTSTSGGEAEEPTPRPIIKEEDLNRMDDIARDVGWATHDDIDYNQKLDFSDEEGGQDEESSRSKHSRIQAQAQTRDSDKRPERDSESCEREERALRENMREKTMSHPPPPIAEPPRGWQQPRPGGDFRGGPQGPSHPQQMNFPPQMRPQQQNHPTGRPAVEEEDNMWRERQRITEEVAIAIERAKQRKEIEEKRFEETRQAAAKKEEKRFEETRQAAAKKLQMLEEKMFSKSSSGEQEESVTSSQSSSANTTPGVNIPIPDWEKDKERDRSRTSSEGKEEKSLNIPSAGENFRQMTQLDSRNTFVRDRERERERDRELRGERETPNQPGGQRETPNQPGGQPAFSRQFQNNLPPRFQKQQAERPQPTYYRQSSGGSPQPPAQSASAYEPRWQNQNNHYAGTTGGNVKGRRNRTDSDVSDREREDDRISKEGNRERRDRITPDNYERERYNRHAGRDRDRGNFDGNWKSSNNGSYHDGSDYNNRGYHEYDNRTRERDSVESEERRDKERDAWERDKENRFLDEHRDSEKKFNDGFVKPRTPVQEDPFDKKDNLRDNRHENEKRERDNNVLERRVSERDRVEQLQRPESRDRPERPQRPDSRDSRASRESRNSRDSMREESKYIQDLVNDREFSWADTPFEPEFKEEKPRRKDYREENRRDVHQSYYQRHIPGPITKEKLEASDRSEPQRLVPLVKSDKQPEFKKSDGQKDAVECKSPLDSLPREQAWQHQPPPPPPPTATPPQSVATEPESWADAIDEPTSASQSPLPQSDKPISNEQDNVSGVEVTESVDAPQQNVQTEEHITVKNDHEEIGLSHKMDPHRERDKTNNRGNRGIRHDPRSGQRHNWGSNFSVFRGSWNSRGGDSRGRRGGAPRASHRSNQDWRQSESECSGDEVSASTESGKEERERRQDRERKPTPRSPKQGPRKSDKENRNREARRSEGDKGGYSGGGEGRRYDKRGNYIENNKVGNSGREGFAPRGEPSRRGRGGFRARESASNVGRRLDGYGPPSSKSPFTSQQAASEDKKSDVDSDKSSLVTERKEDGHRSGELNTDDPIKMNQQLLSAGIIAREVVLKYVGPHQNSKKLSSVPPRMQRKSESDRRERSSGKSKDDIRKGSRNVAKGGPGGSDPADEAWETTSENSEQDDRTQDETKNYDQRQRNYPPNRHTRGAGSRRTSNLKIGPGEKRNSNSFDRERDHTHRSQHQSHLNGRTGGSSNNKIGSNLPPGCGKDQTQVNRTDDIKFIDPNLVSQTIPDSKKQPRPEKDKINNLDHIDLSNFASVVIVDDHPEGTMEEEHSVFASDNGFQEVRSKKNVKEANRQLKEEAPLKAPRGGSIGPKGMKQVSGNKPPGTQSPGPVGGPSQSPAMSAPQNDPPTQNTSMKVMFERPRASKLPPRLAKVRENNRLQKAAQQQQQQQQQQQHHDVSEMNKVNQNVGLFPVKDLSSNPAPPPSVNAWDKPITAVLRTNSPPMQTGGTIQLTSLNSAVENCGIEINEHTQSGASSQRSSPSTEKALSKVGRETMEKTVLDGTSPPVQTIIFENTNYKSSPADLAMKAKFNNHLKNQRIDKGRERKMDEDPHSVGLGFKPPGSEVKDNRTEPIQMPMSFNKNEDNADMKLDFSFDSELSQLTDDKTSKSMGMPRSMHMVQSSTADLNFKIASVKKVWESEASALEQHHTEDGIAVSTSSSFTPSFGNSVEDAGPYVKAGVTVVDSTGVVQVDGSAEVVYNNGPQIQNSANNYTIAGGPNMIKNDPNSASSNVCKLLAPQVKPQPQAVISSGGLGEHVHAGPLSPPPGAFNSSNAQPSGHINYQPTAAQYSGMSVPSPPAMLFNSSQQLPAQGELYQAFQISGAQVLGGQGRSQFSQFPHYSLSQGLSQTSAFSQQSVYLHQTAPPPNGGPPDMFQPQLSQFRIQPPPTYGTSQQMNSNPNTVLISSNSNSLMSANVKPSTPQIGAIGSKGAYQPSAQHSQVYISYDPMLNVNQSYLSNSQLVAQRPGNVPTIPPSSSYYSASTGGQTGFYPPGNSSLQAAQAAQPLHQTTPFGMQGYTTQSPAATPVGMQSFGSQMAQQYRTTAPSFLKSSGGVPLVSDPSKSPQQDILNSVFSSATQISSPKSRSSGAPNSGGSGKQSGNGPSQQQPSPTQGHHKFSTYQNATQTNQLVMQQQQQQQVGSRNAQVGSMNVHGGNLQAQTPFYPSPIQRPVAFQQAIPEANSNNMMPGRHRVPSRAPSHVSKMRFSIANVQYYLSQNSGVKLENNEMDSKVEGMNQSNKDCKISDSATASKSSSAADPSTEDNTPTTD